MSGQVVEVMRHSEAVQMAYEHLDMAYRRAAYKPTVKDLNAGEIATIRRHLEEARAMLARHGLEV